MFGCLLRDKKATSFLKRRLLSDEARSSESTSIAIDD